MNAGAKCTTNKQQMMNQWQQPPHEDASARIKPRKTKKTIKGKRRREWKAKEKELLPALQKAPTNAPPPAHLSQQVLLEQKLQRMASPIDMRQIGSQFQNQVKVQCQIGRMA